MNTLALYRLSPALIPLISAFLILLVEVFIKNSKNMSFFLSLISVVSSFILCFFLFPLNNVLLFGNSLYVGQIWILLSALLLITVTFIILFSYKDKDLTGEYYFFVLMSACSMMGIAASWNLLLTFLFIELL